MCRVKTHWINQLNENTLNDRMRIYMLESEIPEFDPTPAIHEWFAAGVRRKSPDTVKPLNQDHAHKLTVELLEDEEGVSFLIWKMAQAIS